MKKLTWVALSICMISCSQQRVDNVKTAGNYFEWLFKKGDFESIGNIVAPDAIYNQASGLPYGGQYKGFEEWIKMFTRAQSYVDLELVEGPTFFPNADQSKVFASFKVKFKAKPTGAEITMDIAELLEFENGKISRITPYYFDTKSFVDVLSLGIGHF